MTLLATPTADTGASSKPTPMTYVPLSRSIVGEPPALPELGGLNLSFVLDKMSDVLTHERCGAHLYRSVAQRTNNPMLKAKYEKFGEETARHTQLAADVIALLGGDPMYVSPSARATEAMDTSLLQSTFLLDGSADPVTAEMVMLDAVFLAESIDHANWKTLTALIASMDDSPLQGQLREIIDQVEQEEDEHLEWARDMRERMTMLEAKSSAMAGAMLRVEEVVTRVRGWFS